MHVKSLITVLVITALLASTAAAETIGIGTTGPGSVTHSTGSAIAKLVTQETGLQVRVQPHGGNNVAVPAANAGEVEFASSNVYELKDGLAGTGIYKGQVLDNLRIVSVLMPLRVCFFVKEDSPIKSLKDFKGKRIPGVFKTQKVVGLLTTGMLANAGLTYDDVKMIPVPNVLRGADDFAQGKSDAFFFAVGSGKIREVGAKVGGVRALPIDSSPEAMARFREHMPVVYPLELKPSKPNYGILSPTNVAAFDLLFITNKNVSEDVVYKVTKALHGGKKVMFASFKPLGAYFSPQQMAKDLPYGEYHPGAIKFYKETGMWPPKIKYMEQ